MLLRNILFELIDPSETDTIEAFDIDLNTWTPLTETLGLAGQVKPLKVQASFAEIEQTTTIN